MSTWRVASGMPLMEAAAGFSGAEAGFVFCPVWLPLVETFFFPGLAGTAAFWTRLPLTAAGAAVLFRRLTCAAEMLIK
ncbi:MAG: hypothetical protein HPY46_01875 [Candidatus Aminicenantes bacterium]|nr:hypothetical protein [Candidatus Aminicenantes bacterium]